MDNLVNLVRTDSLDLAESREHLDLVESPEPMVNPAATATPEAPDLLDLTDSVGSAEKLDHKVLKDLRDQVDLLDPLDHEESPDSAESLVRTVSLAAMVVREHPVHVARADNQDPTDKPAHQDLRWVEEKTVHLAH